MQQRYPAAMPSGPLARACDGDHAGAGVGSAPAHAVQMLFNSHDRSAQIATAAASSYGRGANSGYAAPAQCMWALATGATYGSVFDLSLSGRPPPGSEAPAPPKQKTKTDRFLTVT